MGTLGAVSSPIIFVNGAELSYTMMVVAGGLLFVAAVLMGIHQRKPRIQSGTFLSVEDLKVYLLRIANALERLERPSGEEAANELRRLQGLAQAMASGKVTEMPKYRRK